MSDTQADPISHAEMIAAPEEIARAEAYRLFTKDWNECGSCPEAFWRALQSEREAAAARNLFVAGEFTAHSGGTLPFKIDCDALSDADIATLAAEIARRFRFDAVYGVPRGGVRLADALAVYLDPSADRTLIVDDVLTTGRSMEEAKARLLRDGAAEADPVGIVIFARGPCPPWISPLFATPEVCEDAAAEARRALETISHLARKPDGGRTADEMSSDLRSIADTCRRALASPAPQEDGN